MKKILLIFTLFFAFSFSAFGFFIDKKILDAYFEAHYPVDTNNNPIPDDESIYYTYNQNKTNTVTISALYLPNIDKDKADVTIKIYTDKKIDDTIKEVSFFNDDFIATFSVTYIADYNYILIYESNFLLFTDISKLKTIRMFQNGNIQMMYNYKGKTYKYPIDDKTSSMVAKMLDLGFKK
ncbi:hypothetical protein [Brachyspira catarrhinii]|uniref:Lipoprotein n=1 Tax=Brachyspira catarrhinii TaxID=2528966 RepID=A0ABY2TQZ6_9SPIR|nr:hypothetical protein [Brachyspira catarrhinii]TKZ31714.1 hypothetical protein EZH24_09725 [Brachyspira catarrhinii]